MKKKRMGIISVNLQYEIPNGENIEEYLENIELPKEYVENSFQFVKEIEEEV